MTRVNLYVSQPHYVSHCAPVFNALPEDARGTVYTAPRADIDFEFRRHGITCEFKLPPREPLTMICSGNDLGGFDHPILLSHGIDQTYRGVDHPSYAGGLGRGHVVRFLVPNEPAAAANRLVYPYIPAVVVGSPHVEYLQSLTYVRRWDVCWSRHWAPGLIAEMCSAWPHFAAEIKEWCVTHRESSCLHAHPRASYNARRDAAIWDVAYVSRFEQVIESCAIYVTDNSSTTFEAAACGRPVILLESPKWGADAWKHGGRFARWAEVGTRTGGGVESALAAVFTPPASILDEVFPIREGAAKAAADAILECL